jgi:hypothetical protein
MELFNFQLNQRNLLCVVYFFVGFLTLNSGCSSASKDVIQVPHSVDAFINEVATRLPVSELKPHEFALAKLDIFLAEKKITPAFYSLLKKKYLNPEQAYSQQSDWISKNILGFLIQPNYAPHFTAETLDASKKFIKKNHYWLNFAEKKYGVSKHAITALLWVETRFGKRTGTNPVLGVYTSLLQADHPLMIRQSLERLAEQRPDADLAMKEKVIDRSKKKSDWALEQLIALNTIQTNHHLTITKILASYAGAFGICQFIPSSYVELAVSRLKKYPADLSSPADAILSVGNYLSKKGWNSADPASQAEALYQYNRSRDYGAIILKIAAELDSPSL